MSTTPEQQRTYTYKWTKVWAVQTPHTDSVQKGEIIEVGGASPSKQEVQSVTVMFNRSGQPYKTLLLKEVK
jgi:hypothetical protein